VSPLSLFGRLFGIQKDMLSKPRAEREYLIHAFCWVIDEVFVRSFAGKALKQECKQLDEEVDAYAPPPHREIHSLPTY